MTAKHESHPALAVRNTRKQQRQNRWRSNLQADINHLQNCCATEAFCETYACLNLELALRPAEADLIRVCCTALLVPITPSCSKN
jgi:hypothetical protein